MTDYEAKERLKKKQSHFSSDYNVHRVPVSGRCIRRGSRSNDRDPCRTLDFFSSLVCSSGPAEMREEKRREKEKKVRKGRGPSSVPPLSGDLAKWPRQSGR